MMVTIVRLGLDLRRLSGVNDSARLNVPHLNAPVGSLWLSKNGLRIRANYGIDQPGVSWLGVAGNHLYEFVFELLYLGVEIKCVGEYWVRPFVVRVEILVEVVAFMLGSTGEGYLSILDYRGTVNPEFLHLVVGVEQRRKILGGVGSFTLVVECVCEGLEALFGVLEGVVFVLEGVLGRWCVRWRLSGWPR